MARRADTSWHDTGKLFDARMEMQLTLRQLSVLALFKILGNVGYRHIAEALCDLFPGIYETPGRTAAHSTVYTMAIRGMLRALHDPRGLKTPSEKQWAITDSGRQTLSAMRNLSRSLFIRGGH